MITTLVGVILNNCTRCHSQELIYQNNLDRRQWDKIITEMEVKHGLEKLADTTRKEIINYLANNYGQIKDTVVNPMGTRAVNPLPLIQP